MLIDQQTDKGKKALYSMLGAVENQELKQSLKNTTFNQASIEGSTPKHFAYPSKRLFPVNTPENTMLSKVYFDSQQQQLDPTEARNISKVLDTHIELHNIPADKFTYKQATASDKEDSLPMLKEAAYMLPEYAFCKVANSTDLGKARKLFDKGNARLQLADRVEFAHNFVKAASEMKEPIKSEEIMKYAGILDFDAVHTQYALELRSGLANRKGKNSEKFHKLAGALKEFSGKPSREELLKLAHVVTDLDAEVGITEKDYNDFIESPFGVVFTKVAAEASEAMEGHDSKLEDLSKADIVGRFGDDVLEIVEKEDGTIDYEALKDVDNMTKGLG